MTADSRHVAKEPRYESLSMTTLSSARPKVSMLQSVSDCSIGVMKRGNARRAKGAGHRHWARVNRQREEPDVQCKAAAFARWHEPDDARGVKSGICERLGVKFPGPTRCMCR